MRFSWRKNCLQCSTPSKKQPNYTKNVALKCEWYPFRGNFKWWEVSVYKFQLRDHYKMLITADSCIVYSALWCNISSVAQRKTDVISIELTMIISGFTPNFGQQKNLVFRRFSKLKTMLLFEMPAHISKWNVHCIIGNAVWWWAVVVLFSVNQSVFLGERMASKFVNF